MKEENKKRIIILTIAILLGMTIGGLVFGVGHTALPDIVSENIENTETEIEVIENADSQIKEPEIVTNSEKTKESDINSASKKVLGNVTKRDKRMAELKDKYADDVYGMVAYYLEIAQKYSFPICFIGIAMGCFNFLIIR